MFMFFAPVAGERQVFIRGGQRTRKDFAAANNVLINEIYPRAKRIVLVLDQLNTHDVASLYVALSPEEARRLSGKLKTHHPPQHGSRLNMAES
jgi:hypothetical protein